MRLVAFLSVLVATSCAAPHAVRPHRTLGAIPAPAAPDGADLRSATPAELVAVALSANPEVRKAQAAHDAAEGRAVQAGLWPNPRLALEARDVPRHPMAIDRGGRWAVVTQPLALGGRIGAARDAAGAERDAASFDVESVRRRAAADVRRACADVAASQSAVGLRAESASGARDLLEGARRRAASGAAAPVEVEALAIESERAQVELRREERALAASLAELRALLGGAAPRLARVEWPHDDDPYRAFGADEDPCALRAAAARTDAAGARVREAKSARVPDVEVSLAYGRIGAADAEQVEAGIAFSLPVFDRNQGRILAASAEVRSAAAEEDRVRAEFLARRERALAELAASTLDAASHRDRILPAAERLAAQMASAFEQGARTATDVVLARRFLAEAQLGLVEAERRIRRAHAELIEVGRPRPQEEGR